MVDGWPHRENVTLSQRVQMSLIDVVAGFAVASSAAPLLLLRFTMAMHTALTLSRGYNGGNSAGVRERS